MVDHRIDPLHGKNGLLQPPGINAYAACDLRPQVRHTVLVQVHHSSQAGVLGEDLRILRVIQVVLYASQVCHLPYQVREYGVIDGGSTIRGPDKPLQAVAGVNDIVFHLFIALALDLYSARRRGHQIHEHQSGQLQAAHHNLHARPGIAPTGPGILLVGHRQRIHPQANEQLVTKPHSPVLPVDLPIRGVEYVVGHHLKGGEMPPAPPH
ncbi:hypothetical protein ASZ90_011434 [hydrocarbon metagenome]|uniref:Uncharacterized protein n=1 Tax=hydrocarbon metagenome TaxID=938273 RepID=A0A0W8FD79_9ZZZZ